MRVSPGAARTAWVGRLADGRLKARVAAPPEGGRANRELIALVARSLGVDRRRVRLVAGAASRDKILEVDAAAGDVERLGTEEERGGAAPGKGRTP